MHHLPNLTIAALLDHAEARLPPCGVPAARAYLADAAARVAVVEMPAPQDSEEHAALGAILGLEMRERAAVLAVIQLPAGGGLVALHGLDREGAEVARRFVAPRKAHDDAEMRLSTR